MSKKIIQIATVPDSKRFYAQIVALTNTGEIYEGTFTNEGITWRKPNQPDFEKLDKEESNEDLASS